MKLRGLLPLLCLLTPATTVAAPADDLKALLEEAWEWRLDQQPVFASRLGDRRGNDRWADLSLDAFAARHQQRADYLRRLQAIDPGTLSDQDRL
ncbi:MAG: DUF885 domain-containing protein, partial [Pseudomonadota bacterium]